MNIVKMSREKLLEHGYVFLRKDDSRPEPVIKICREYGTWTTFEKFKTKAERDRAMDALVSGHGSFYLVLEK